MKRFFTFFFALVATTTLWAYDFQSGDLYYNITSSSEPYTVEVTSSGSASYSGSVTIPETVTYDGITYSVTSIGNSAFWNCDGLTSITIPNSVTSLGGGAFRGCSGLTSVTIPNSVTSIGNHAFNGCSGLTSVTIPNSVTSIGWNAFMNCSGLTSITIPNSVTSIGYGAFIGCSGLTSPVYNAHCFAYMPSSYSGAYTIPEGIKQIAGGAFHGCSGLTSIIIPNSVTSIGDRAFEYCSGLTSIVVEEGNTMYDSRENCNALIETASNTLITGCQNTIIPNSLTSIEAYAFSRCSGLTSITIPNSVTSIGSEAFSYCSGLTSITIPNSVTSIGGSAFEDCSGLTSVTIGNSVTSIGEEAFYGTAFYHNPSNWDKRVLYIDNCLIAAETFITGYYNIKESTRLIADEAFYQCSALTSITIPNSVTSIGNHAFNGCSGLTSITIPNSVTSIGEWAFGSCSGLTSITIPNSVTSIGNNAFRACSSLAVVNVEATTPPTLGTYAVFSSSPTCNIPCGTLEVYQASNWKNVVGEFVEQCSDDSGDDGDMDKDLTIVFSDRDNNQISAQTVTLRVPVAPEIAGFTFLYWLPVAEPVDDVITLQAVYESNTPTAAPEVYVNPSNPAQKLIRNGQVYILHEEKMYTISGQVVK